MCFFAVCFCRSLKFCVYLGLFLLKIWHGISISFLLIIRIFDTTRFLILLNRVTCSSTLSGHPSSSFVAWLARLLIPCVFPLEFFLLLVIVPLALPVGLAVSRRPVGPVSRWPGVPLARCPVVPLARCPVVPLSRWPGVPLSRCPVVPLSRGRWRASSRINHKILGLKTTTLLVDKHVVMIGFITWFLAEVRLSHASFNQCTFSR